MLQLWLGIMMLLFLAPFIVMGVIPEVKYLIAFVVLISIYSFIRQFFGDSLTTLVLTVAAAYYLLIKNFWITTGLWWIYIVLGTAVFSSIGWTLITIGQLFRRKY